MGGKGDVVESGRVEACRWPRHRRGLETETEQAVQPPASELRIEASECSAAEQSGSTLALECAVTLCLLGLRRCSPGPGTAAGGGREAFPALPLLPAREVGGWGGVEWNGRVEGDWRSSFQETTVRFLVQCGRRRRSC